MRERGTEGGREKESGRGSERREATRGKGEEGYGEEERAEGGEKGRKGPSLRHYS